MLLGGFIGVLWIAPVLVAQKMATEKGYERGVGIALGVFLGWIGVLIIALITARPGGPAGGATKACPFCAERVQWAAKVCKHCGRDIASEPNPEACQECGAPPSHPPTPKCVRCGAVKV